MSVLFYLKVFSLRSWSSRLLSNAVTVRDSRSTRLFGFARVAGSGREHEVLHENVNRKLLR